MMAFVSFADDSALYDSTAFDNMFIIEFMPTAPEKFLKVYMYARMLCLHPELGGEDELSRALTMTPEDIAEAFAYWERMGLVVRVSDQPRQYRFIASRISNTTPFDRSYYEYRDFNNSLQSLFGEKIIHSEQLRQAQDWMSTFGFSQDAVITLIRNTIARSRSEQPRPATIFKTADKVALRMAEAGYITPEDIDRMYPKDTAIENTAREVIRQLGLRRNPTQPEIELTTKWIKEWRLSNDDIMAACAVTVSAQNPSFAYIDSILKRGERSAEFDAMREVFKSLGLSRIPTAEHENWYRERIADGFEPAAIIVAAVQQGAKKNNSLDALGKTLETWKNMGIFAQKDAEEFITRNRALLGEFSALLTGIGVTRNLSADEIYAYGEWKKTFGDEMLAYVVSLAGGNKAPVEYIARTIARWKKDGITTIDAARNAGSAKKTEGNPALNYTQRDYGKDDYRDDRLMELTGDDAQ